MTAAVLSLAIVGYVSVGAEGAVAGLAILILLLALLIGLLRARSEPERAEHLNGITARVLTLLPGAALVDLSFNAGGSFPGSPALLAVVMALILAARLLQGTSTGLTSRLSVGITAAFIFYTLWILLSGTWSHAFERALTKADLPLLYGLGFVLFATSATGARDMRWVLRGLALGSVVVCLGAFLSRALPALWPIPASLATDDRVSYPLTYQNTLGFLAAIGILVCFGLTTDDRESQRSRALSAMAIPLLAATLLLTFSRGAIAVGAIGLAAYLLVGRPRATLNAMAAVLPTAGLAVLATYKAPELAHRLVASPAQTREGRLVTLIVVLCGLAAAVARVRLPPLEGRLPRVIRPRAPVSATSPRRTAAGIVGIVVLGGVAVGLPSRLVNKYHELVRNQTAASGSPTSRLTNVGSDGRVAIWRVAWHEFEGAPLAGTGAGTYEVVWDARQPASAMTAAARPILYAHSIYLESLAELGIVGFGLLISIVAGSLVAIGRRIRGPDRALYATAFAVALAWAIQAGFDWDWEMPAVTLPVFVLAGAALGRSGSAVRPTDQHRRLGGLAAILIAIVPALVVVSQSHLDAGLSAFEDHNCTAAASAARSSLRPLDFRRASHEILGYCDAAGDQPAAAVTEMTAAVHDDPEDWEAHYGLAIALAIRGSDPRPQARAAQGLSPYQPLAAALATELATDVPTRWAASAASAGLPVSGTEVADLHALGR